MDYSYIFESILIAFYSVISAFCIIQIYKIVIYKHDLASFQFAFVSLSLVWCLTRAAFLIILMLNDSFGGYAYVIVYRVPFSIQFATYTLIVLFYLKILNRDNWPQVEKIYKIIYWVANIAFLLFILILYALPISETTKGDIFLWAISLIWLGLVFVLGWVAFHLSEVIEDRQNQVLFQASGISKQSILYLTFFLFFIFVSRSLIDIFAILIFDAPDLNSAELWQSFTAFLCFWAWEVAPTLIILFLFRTIPMPRYARVLQDPSQSESYDSSNFVHQQDPFIGHSINGPGSTYGSFPDFSLFAAAISPSSTSSVSS